MGRIKKARSGSTYSDDLTDNASEFVRDPFSALLRNGQQRYLRIDTKGCGSYIAVNTKSERVLSSSIAMMRLETAP